MTHALADQVAEFAENTHCQHLSALIARLRRPLRVAVTGRDGVGRGTVATALERRGVVVARAGEVCDVLVLVVAESVKPEDIAVLRASRRPSLIVLTKADLAGAGPGGPVEVARRRAAALRTSTGTPSAAMVGLLAALDPAADLDCELVVALQSLLTEPADLSSIDTFVDVAHPISRGVRARLIERLDRFGIAHAVLALAGGSGPGELPAYLHRLGNGDEVMAALDAAAAPVRYQRVRAAMFQLHSLAVQFDDIELYRLLVADATVLAAMSAAVDVVEADGLVVDRGTTQAAHLDRAVRWRRYGGGPVNTLHHRCSRDIVRGSLRMLAAARTPAT